MCKATFSPQAVYGYFHYIFHDRILYCLNVTKHLLMFSCVADVYIVCAVNCGKDSLILIDTMSDIFCLVKNNDIFTRL